MRLVVITNYSDYEYSCTTTIPFEYESAEQLLIDLETLANNALVTEGERTDAWEIFQNKWDLNIPKHKWKEKQIDAWYKEYDELSNKYPFSYNETGITSGESTILITNLIENGRFIAPEILTVDEWFAQSKLN